VSSASPSTARAPHEIIVALPPNGVRKAAQLLEPLLGSVITCSHGTNDFESILELAENGKVIVWVAMRCGEAVGACVTEIVSYPRAKVLRVWAGSGDWQAFVANLGYIERHARIEGCSQIHVDGPPYVADYLKGHFDLVRVTMKREVGDG